MILYKTFHTGERNLRSPFYVAYFIAEKGVQSQKSILFYEPFSNDPRDPFEPCGQRLSLCLGMLIKI